MLVKIPEMSSEEYHEIRQFRRNNIKRKKKLKKAEFVRNLFLIICVLLFSLIVVKIIFFSDVVVSDSVIKAFACENINAILLDSEIKTNIDDLPYSKDEIDYLSKTVYGEALVTHSKTEMAAVVWCALNRVDSDDFPDTIAEVVTQEKQFHGYNSKNPVNEDVKNLCIDVYMRWYSEKSGENNVGRILPKEYLYFVGNGSHNVFSTEYHSGKKWDWNLKTPYES